MNPIDSNSPIRPSRVDTDATARGRDARGTSGAGGASAGTVAGDGSESVTLTQEASSLLQLEQQLRDLPSVDQARVTAIQSAIADGSYRVDVEGIVDSLLRAESELR